MPGHPAPAGPPAHDGSHTVSRADTFTPMCPRRRGLPVVPGYPKAAATAQLAQEGPTGLFQGGPASRGHSGAGTQAVAGDRTPAEAATRRPSWEPRECWMGANLTTTGKATEAPRPPGKLGSGQSPRWGPEGWRTRRGWGLAREAASVWRRYRPPRLAQLSPRHPRVPVPQGWPSRRLPTSSTGSPSPKAGPVGGLGPAAPWVGSQARTQHLWPKPLVLTSSWHRDIPESKLLTHSEAVASPFISSDYSESPQGTSQQRAAYRAMDSQHGGTVLFVPETAEQGCLVAQ